MLKNFKRYEVDNSVKVILGKDFVPNQKKFKGPMPKTQNYLVYKFLCNSDENQDNGKSVNYLTVFQCKEATNCNLIRFSFSKFSDHIRSHTSERPFACHFPNCGFAFAQRPNLYTHLKIHDENRQKKFYCVCGKGSYRLRTHTNHQERCKIYINK